MGDKKHKDIYALSMIENATGTVSPRDVTANFHLNSVRLQGAFPVHFKIAGDPNYYGLHKFIFIFFPSLAKCMCDDDVPSIKETILEKLDEIIEYKFDTKKHFGQLFTSPPHNDMNASIPKGKRGEPKPDPWHNIDLFLELPPKVPTKEGKAAKKDEGAKERENDEDDQSPSQSKNEKKRKKDSVDDDDARSWDDLTKKHPA